VDSNESNGQKNGEHDTAHQRTSIAKKRGCTHEGALKRNPSILIAWLCRVRDAIVAAWDCCTHSYVCHASHLTFLCAVL